jgi:hypothetical protein
MEGADHLRRIIELEKAEAVRHALEAAAKALEPSGPLNEAYRKAWKKAAWIIRSLKP